MHNCFAVALIALGVAVNAACAQHIDAFDWTHADPAFGGMSGIEVSADGASFLVVSDIGFLYEGALSRAQDDRLVGVQDVIARRVTLENGETEGKKKHRDTEGLALRPDGRLYMSLEGNHRVIETDIAANKVNAVYPFGSDVVANKNGGFEALAVDAQGVLYALPEVSASLITPFPIMRLEPDGHWRMAAELPRAGNFRPVGADFGPNGSLYVLSRAFSGFAFASRIDRVTFDRDMKVNAETIFTSAYGQFDNLEGLSAWVDADGNLRLTLVSDDNFSSFQRTQIVELTFR